MPHSRSSIPFFPLSSSSSLSIMRSSSSSSIPPLDNINSYPINHDPLHGQHIVEYDLSNLCLSTSSQEMTNAHDDDDDKRHMPPTEVKSTNTKTTSSPSLYPDPDDLMVAILVADCSNNVDEIFLYNNPSSQQPSHPVRQPLSPPSAYGDTYSIPPEQDAAGLDGNCLTTSADKLFLPPPPPPDDTPTSTSSNSSHVSLPYPFPHHANPTTTNHNTITTVGSRSDSDLAFDNDDDEVNYHHHRHRYLDHHLSMNSNSGSRPRLLSGPKSNLSSSFSGQITSSSSLSSSSRLRNVSTSMTMKMMMKPPKPSWVDKSNEIQQKIEAQHRKSLLQQQQQEQQQCSGREDSSNWEEGRHHNHHQNQKEYVVADNDEVVGDNHQWNQILTSHPTVLGLHSVDDTTNTIASSETSIQMGRVLTHEEDDHHNNHGMQIPRDTFQDHSYHSTPPFSHVEKDERQRTTTTTTANGSNDRDDHCRSVPTINTRYHPPRPQVEISPGCFMILRGTDETMEAVESGRAKLVFCYACPTAMQCVPDCDVVICPECRVFSPVPKYQPSQTDNEYDYGIEDAICAGSQQHHLLSDQPPPPNEEQHANKMEDGSSVWIGGVGLGLKVSFLD